MLAAPTSKQLMHCCKRGTCNSFAEISRRTLPKLDRSNLVLLVLDPVRLECRRSETEYFGTQSRLTLPETQQGSLAAILLLRITHSKRRLHPRIASQAIEVWLEQATPKETGQTHLLRKREHLRGAG